MPDVGAVRDDISMGDGIQFERETCRALTNLGWQVDFTQTTGDGGVDLVARSGDEVLVVQCKDQSEPVGISAMQEIHFGRSLYKAGHAVVVSRSGFTHSGRKHAARLVEHGEPVHLLMPRDLSSGCAFDRTEQGRLIRARLAAQRQEAEQRRADEQRQLHLNNLRGAWEAYDVAVARHRHNSLKYDDGKAIIVLGWGIAILIAYFSMAHRPTDMGAFFVALFGVAIGCVHAFVLRNPGSAPIQPSEPRPKGPIAMTLVPQPLIAPQIHRSEHAPCEMVLDPEHDAYAALLAIRDRDT